MSPKGCQACHAETKADLGCEGCHGPGKAHADADGDKTKITSFASGRRRTPARSASSCHYTTKHALWAGSQHDQRNVGCTSCHTIHAPEGREAVEGGG